MWRQSSPILSPFLSAFPSNLPVIPLSQRANSVSGCLQLCVCLCVTFPPSPFLSVLQPFRVQTYASASVVYRVPCSGPCSRCICHSSVSNTKKPALLSSLLTFNAIAATAYNPARSQASYLSKKCHPFHTRRG